MKKVWSIIAILAVFGIIFMVAGYALGADTTDAPDFLRRNTIMTHKVLSETVQKNTEPITAIRVDVLSADIEIIPADYYGYELIFNRDSDAEYRFENGALTVEQEHRWFPFGWIPFTGRRILGSVRIYLPRDAQLSDITLETASGNIKARNFTAGELEASSKSGNIRLEKILARRLDVDVTSGTSTISDCSAEIAEIGGASSRFTAENFIVGKEFDADIISGSLSLSGELHGNADIRMVSGSVKLDLAGKSAEYNKKLSSVSGSIRINGNKTGAYTESTNAPNSLKIHTTSGSVSVNFSE